MCRPGTKARRSTSQSKARLIAVVAAVGFGAALGGCSDMYYDRRDTIALSGGDAVTGNAVAQMVDPWPPQSGNTNIAFNGQKMQTAVELYRTGKVIPPADPENLQSANQPSPPTTQINVSSGSTTAAQTNSQ